VELFDGKSLKEWMVKRRAKHTDKRYLVVDDGEITAQTPPGSDHHYI